MTLHPHMCTVIYTFGYRTRQRSRIKKLLRLEQRVECILLLETLIDQVSPLLISIRPGNSNMDPTKVRVEEPSPIESDNSASATRKTLHQNILGKLRPLPLQYHWTFWYDKHAEGSSDYDDRLYVLYEDVSDIATFYRVYNNYPWDKIPQRDTVHIFRKGVKPVWEDPENLKGGCWRFRVPKRKAQAFFHEIAILCLANEFQAALEKEHDHVLGVSTSVRFNTHLVSVWNKLGSNERSIRILEETILSRLSPNLRPTDPGPNSYFYKRHDQNDGYKEAVEQQDAPKE